MEAFREPADTESSKIARRIIWKVLENTFFTVRLSAGSSLELRKFYPQKYTQVYFLFTHSQIKSAVSSIDFVASTSIRRIPFPFSPLYSFIIAS